MQHCMQTCRYEFSVPSERNVVVVSGSRRIAVLSSLQLKSTVHTADR